MKEFIKMILMPFQKKSAESLLQESIEEVKRQLISTQAQAVYASKMVEYYELRLATLRLQITNGIEGVAEK
jgi:hypothetical protein